jgi:hypothetical protein
MHVSATKRHYLNEQTPQPKVGVVNAPSGTIGFSEVAGSASMVPIVNASVLTKIGIPATPENFNNTFFYTDKNGLLKASASKNLGTFTMTTKRITKSPDNVVAKYVDGSEIKIEGAGTQEFLTKGLKVIGGAGNGLLALQRALFSGTGKLPAKITITLSGGMEGSSYKYDSGYVNKTKSTFNQLLAHFIKPLVDPTKVSTSYPFRDIVTGNPKPSDTITNNLNSLLGRFVPRPLNQSIQKYGLDMTPEVFEKLINASAEVSQLNTKWNEIENKIITKYKENLDTFLTQKFPQNKDFYLSKFNPETSQRTPSMELEQVSGTYKGGTSSPRLSPNEKQQNQQFKIGQGN